MTRYQTAAVSFLTLFSFRFSLLPFSLLLFVLLLAPAVSAQGEKTSPERGINPGGSYALSDIETISLQSGNLMFNMPLGSLPAGRGGLSAGVGLHYNSKIWDMESTPAEGELPATEILKPSADGGWRYGYKYELRDETYCRESGYVNKFQLVMPDGSKHLLVLPGFTDIDGYVAHGIDGAGTCVADPPFQTVSETRTFSTIDGSYLRVDVLGDGNSNALDNSWILYLPDGKRVVHRPVEAPGVEQRVYDRNGNFLDYLETASDANYGGRKTTTVQDQLGRKIVIVYASDENYNALANQDLVVSKGFGGAQLVTKVQWKTITVRKEYRYCITGAWCNLATFRRPLVQDFTVVEKVILPAQLDSLDYVFEYNADTTSNPTVGWGEVSAVTVPSDARSAYSYKKDNVNGIGNIRAYNVLANHPVSKTLTYHQEYDNTSTPVTETWNYQVFYYLNLERLQDVERTVITAPNGAVSTEYFNYYSWYQELSPVGYASKRGLSKSESPDGTTIERIYQNNIPADPTVLYAANNYLKYEFTSIKDAAGNLTKTAVKEFSQDKNGNITSAKEYDFVLYSSVPRDGSGKPTGLPTGAVPARISATDYYNDTPDASATNYTDPESYHLASSPRIRNAAKSAEVRNGSNTAVSRSEMFYDNASTTGNLTQTKVWDSWKNGSYQAYSNPLTSDNSIFTSIAYNAYGSPTLITDANGVQTQITYGSISTGSGTVSDLYPTQTISGYGTTIAQTSQAVYDFSTGLVKQTTALGHNTNENMVSETVYDALGRPTISKAAVGKPEEVWTRMEYFDAARYVVSKADLFTKDDGRKISIQHYDQLGRVRLSRTLEDASTQSATNEQHGIKVQNRYLTSGNHTYQLSSNPYRAAFSSGAGSEGTMGWTRSKADNAGKHSEVETFSGSTLPAPFLLSGGNTNSTGIVTTDRDAERVLVTDQAGKKRISQSNALGQLIKVWEIKDADSDTESISFGSPVLNLNGLVTTYSYDTLSNLTTVNQGGQTRSFAYSSLSRLKSATNPELGTTPTNGTIVYKYDLNGNLLTKTDPRLVTTTYSYDQLNRVLTRTYSGETGGTTPAVTYSYDGTGLGTVPYSKGKLTKVSSAISETRYTSFDTLGRITASEQRTTAGQLAETETPYQFTYKYNLSGALEEEKYPSGRVVRNNFDVDGDLAAVSSRSKAIAPMKPYANNFTYTAYGAVSAMQLGNGRWETTLFNERLQPTQLALGTSAADTSLWKVNFSYGGAQNNGNVVSQTITVPSVTVGGTPYNGFTAAQNYSYDSLNRLQSAFETINSAETWRQTYTFDRFGNRRFDFSTEPGSNPPRPMTTIPSACVEKECNPLIDPATNRLKEYQDADGVKDYEFDASGNMTRDAQGRQFLYDGENKQKEVISAQSQSLGTYFYDGDGKRVKKIADGHTTIFVYDASGKLAAEYSTQTPPAPTEAKTSYLTNDHLGSPRVVTDQTGTVTSRRDFLPFGEEIGVNTPQTAGRSTHPQYTTDNIREKFATYERDDETDLDFAQARMYANKLGRFTTVDPTLKSVGFDEPQTWNRYVYVTNNPLRFVDPLGLWKLQYQDVYRNEEVEEDGKKVTKRILVERRIIAVKSKDGDNAESLLKQLKIDKDSEQGKQLLKSIGNSGEVRLSALGGEVGESYSLFERAVTAQKIWTDSGQKGGPSLPGYQNCAETCARLAFPGAKFTGDFYESPAYIDSLLKKQKNLSKSELKFLDAIRYADGENTGTHYANVIFETDSGAIETFSRSGNGGRLEIRDATSLEAGYGKIQGIGKDKTGFYSRQEKRK